MDKDGTLSLTSVLPSSNLHVAGTFANLPSPMDPFTTLPSEIIQQILSYIPDFMGIESLLSTSPWVKTVFQSQPRRVMLDLVRSNPITTMPEIQQLLYNIATINSPSTHCNSIESYLELCPNARTDSMAEGTPFGLPDQTTTQEIIHLISLAANIQRLACMCLYTMQQNFISAVEKSLGSPAAQRAAEPIVWIEEYRVYWVLWHFQHYSSLWKTAKSRWNWSKESCKNLGDTYMTWNNISTGLREQIWTVASVLGDLGLHPLYGHSHKKGAEETNLEEEEGHEEESSIAAWEFPAETPIPIPFFSSLEPPPSLHSNQGDFPIWSPAPLPDDDSQTEKFWGRTSRSRLEMSNCAPMIHSYTVIIKSRPAFQQAWRDIRQVQPFRRVGAMVWTRWRMYSVGLYSSCPRGMEISTPDGDYVRETDFRLSMYDVISRWLALVGKPPPDVGENYDNRPSTLAKIINPR